MALLLVCMVGIYLSAGRTALATALPVLGMVGLSVLGQVKMPLFRVVLIMVGGLAFVPLVWLALNATPERYAVVFDFVSNLDLAFANPAEFTEFESGLGTGRILIWAKLLYEWRSGTEVQYLLGFGPDTAFLAPHNEFVGFLYQTGILGLFAFLLMLAWQLVLMARVPDRWMAVRLLGCMVGFMIGSFTSNQVWAIEGLLTLALICATTWVALDEKGLGRVGGPAAATAPGSGATAKLAARWTKTKMGARTNPAA